MTVSELIRTKRAVRQFTDEPLSEEAIRSILNAGRRAQSSKNTQPWHFIAIRDPATLRQLAECGAYAGHLVGAPFAVGLVSSTADSKGRVFVCTIGSSHQASSTTSGSFSRSSVLSSSLPVAQHRQQEHQHQLAHI